MNIDDWKSQIKRGTLDFCILLMIRQRPSYGYEIISTLEKYPILAAKENTIYPLLRRLMKEEYVSSSWQESAEGLPPRKYYSITDKGLEYISAMSKEWNNLLNQSMKSKENKSMEKLASLFGLIVIPVFAICSPVFIICAIEDVYGKTGSRRYLSGDN